MKGKNRRCLDYKLKLEDKTVLDRRKGTLRTDDGELVSWGRNEAGIPIKSLPVGTRLVWEGADYKLEIEVGENGQVHIISTDPIATALHTLRTKKLLSDNDKRTFLDLINSEVETSVEFINKSRQSPNSISRNLLLAAAQDREETWEMLTHSDNPQEYRVAFSKIAQINPGRLRELILDTTNPPAKRKSALICLGYIQTDTGITPQLVEDLGEEALAFTLEPRLDNLNKLTDWKSQLRLLARIDGSVEGDELEKYLVQKNHPLVQKALYTMAGNTEDFHFEAKTPEGKEFEIEAYKNIIIDLDGTLLNDRGVVERETVKALQDWCRKPGNKISFATTRSIENSLPLLQGLGLKEFYLACDDSKTILHSSGAIVADKSITDKEWHDLSTQLGKKFNLESDGEKIQIKDFSNREIESLQEKLQELYSRGYALDITARKNKVVVKRNGDKSQTLTTLTNNEPSVYIGDGLVDLAAFTHIKKNGGIVVIPNNAPEIVKNSPAADLLIPDNNSNCIAQLLAVDTNTITTLTAEDKRNYTGWEIDPKELENLDLDIPPYGTVRGGKRLGGHVTYHYPRGGEEALPAPEGTLYATGYVKTPAVIALEVESPDITRVDGRRMHITVWTAPGVAPVHSNAVLDKEPAKKLPNPIRLNARAF